MIVTYEQAGNDNVTIRRSGAGAVLVPADDWQRSVRPTLQELGFEILHANDVDAIADAGVDDATEEYFAGELTERELVIARTADLMRSQDAGEVADVLRDVIVDLRDARKLAALVSTAAAKHTGCAARLRREGGNVEAQGKHVANRDAVGRLHNAARLARELLDRGLCSWCKCQADAGVKVTDRSGTCAECGRGLGQL